MNKYETLKYAKPNEILQIMLLPYEQEQMKYIVEEFYRHNYEDIPTGVRNAALIFGIMKAKQNNRLPNAPYLRMVMETFERHGVNTISAAINFLETHKSFQNKQKKASAEPEYMDDYVARIAAMEI